MQAWRNISWWTRDLTDDERSVEQVAFTTQMECQAKGLPYPGNP